MHFILQYEIKMSRVWLEKGLSTNHQQLFPQHERPVRLIRIGLFMDIKQVALQGHGTNLLKFLWKAFRLGIAKNVLAS